jgi:uncharacterized protein YbcI
MLHRDLKGAAVLAHDGGALELDQRLLDLGVDATENAGQQIAAHHPALGRAGWAVVVPLVHPDDRLRHRLQQCVARQRAVPHRRCPLSLSVGSGAREAKGEARRAVETATVPLATVRLCCLMPDRGTDSLQFTHGEVRSAISEGMVALLKEYYGRGPTRAKTYYHDDLVVCLMRGGFSRVEQTLRDGGRGDAVIRQRMEFQEVMRERFQAVIEHATGRSVIGFMSGNQQHPDLMCEVFILSGTDLLEANKLPPAETSNEP